MWSKAPVVLGWGGVQHNIQPGERMSEYRRGERALAPSS